MSRTEQTRLRLLATFSTTRVSIRVADFDQLDANGTRLLHDWMDAACPGTRDPAHLSPDWPLLDRSPAATAQMLQ